jgi:hypothetical protein
MKVSTISTKANGAEWSEQLALTKKNWLSKDRVIATDFVNFATSTSAQ